MVSEKEREVTLKVQYKKQPVALLDFTFWDGANHVAVQARDGLAAFNLVGASVHFDEIKLSVKTAYRECRKEYNIIETLWDLVNKPNFGSTKTVRLEKSKAKEEELAEAPMENAKHNIDIQYKNDIPASKTMALEADRFLSVLETGNADSIKTRYEADAFYQKFSAEGEYEKDWGNRLEIIKFLEKYRTAYLTRDIKTVGMMFAEEAIIIVGRKLESKKLPDDMVKYQKFGNQPDYTYIRLTKKQYLDKQNRIFQSQEDILLDFSTFRMIRKSDPASVYGVEMRQSYASTTYADEGYLFLLIDFNPDTLTHDPLIYVRAWQTNEWSQE